MSYILGIISIILLYIKHVQSCHCVLTPEELEGPFYIPYHLIRSDIRESKPGLRLDLKLTVTDMDMCRPLPNVSVDIWHCDAFGYYSGFTGHSPDQSNADYNRTDNTTFLRGIQMTDSDGVVNFVTNFPGWYYMRAVHIHVKVFAWADHVHTGQFYFPEELTERVVTLRPYSDHQFRRWHNDEDTYFVNYNTTVLKPEPLVADNFGAGIKAEAVLVVT